MEFTLAFRSSRFYLCSMPRTPPPPLSPGQAFAAAERNIRDLQKLAEIGMQRARDLSRKPVDSPAAALSIAEDFERISRAVRRAIALKARLKRQLNARRDLVQKVLLANWTPPETGH